MIPGQTTYKFKDRDFIKVPATLSSQDRIGTWKARWGVGRMTYAVEPGLYAVGNPSGSSHVFVSANYKMSFDFLRSSLEGVDCWILVLDTKGINVWCAAGKGTFSTKELIHRIVTVKLNEIVDHKNLIVPQLGATGVSRHQVKILCGYNVIYGPVRSKDLPEFLKAGLKASKEMRQVLFPIEDRLVLVPMELVGGIKYLAGMFILFFAMSAIGRHYSWSDHLSFGFENILYVTIAYLVGTITGPVLLPYLPGRAFALKGMWTGLIAAIIMLLIMRPYNASVNIFSWLFLMPALTSFILMNFTGASTYTSLSGVIKEMKIAVPLQIIAVVLGLALWITGRFV